MQVNARYRCVQSGEPSKLTWTNFRNYRPLSSRNPHFYQHANRHSLSIIAFHWLYFICDYYFPLRNSIYVYTWRRWICIHRVSPPKYVPALWDSLPAFYLPENSRRFPLVFSVHFHGVVCRGGSFIGPHDYLFHKQTWPCINEKENQTHVNKKCHPHVHVPVQELALKPFTSTISKCKFREFT